MVIEVAEPLQVERERVEDGKKREEAFSHKRDSEDKKGELETSLRYQNGDYNLLLEEGDTYPSYIKHFL